MVERDPKFNANLTMKITTYEPAERPIQIAISLAEMLALVKYHEAQVKRIPKELGKALLQPTPYGVTRAKMAARYQKEGQALVEAHLQRARGLLSILKTTAHNAPSNPTPSATQ
jgi:hypothetical protein